RPEDVAARLAQTARREPIPEARLQDLLTLAREFPDHPATRPALTAGLEDKEEIRLRCAMALGEEGRDALLHLATHHQTGEAGAARASAALQQHLPLEQAQRILSHARRTRRLEVAAAVLEALGRRRAPEAIPAIVEVLSQNDAELALAAIRALAASG